MKNRKPSVLAILILTAALPKITLAETTLSVEVEGLGSVVSVPQAIQCPDQCSASFNNKESVILTAAPDDLQTFIGWSGACDGAGVSCQVRMNKERYVKASFSSQAIVNFPSPIIGPADPEWPNPRFTDNGDNSVTDRLTGLAWLKTANCIASKYPSFDDGEQYPHGGCSITNWPGDGNIIWPQVNEFITMLNSGAFPQCDTFHSDWRLPTKDELESLIDERFWLPPISDASGTIQWSEGNPFNDVLLTTSQSHFTSTPRIHYVPTESNWSVQMASGVLGQNNVIVDDISGPWCYDTGPVWPVRKPE